jgi:hypothetical protein
MEETHLLILNPQQQHLLHNRQLRHPPANPRLLNAVHLEIARVKRDLAPALESAASVLRPAHA